MGLGCGLISALGYRQCCCPDLSQIRSVRAIQQSFRDSWSVWQVPIPDRSPHDMLQGDSVGSLSMVAGDFVEVYRPPHPPSSFDAVTTCFFLDTAHNVFEYMDVIWHVLKVLTAVCSAG